MPLVWSDNCESWPPADGEWDGHVDTLFDFAPPSRILTQDGFHYEGDYSYQADAPCLYNGYAYVDLSATEFSVGMVLWVGFWLYRKASIKEGMILLIDNTVRMRFDNGETIVEAYDSGDITWEGDNFGDDLAINTWWNVVISVRRSQDGPAEPNGLVEAYTRTSPYGKLIKRMSYGGSGNLFNYSLLAVFNTLRMGAVEHQFVESGYLIVFDDVKVWKEIYPKRPKELSMRQPTETSTSSGVVCPFSGVVRA